MSTPHQDLISRIRLRLGSDARHSRLFQNVRGLFWQGHVIDSGTGFVRLSNPRRVDVGLAPGAHDLIGWSTITVTPDMVGRQIAVFTCGDAKVGRDVLDDNQIRFGRAVIEAGGFAGELRSEADAMDLVVGRAPPI